MKAPQSFPKLAVTGVGAVVLLVVASLPSAEGAEPETWFQPSAAQPETAEASETTEELIDRLQASETRLAALEAGLGRINARTEGEEIAEPWRVRTDTAPNPAPARKWYDTFGIRGYGQIRINETLRERSGSFPAHHVGDASVGPNENFMIRRARIIFSGDINDHVSIYLQPDFASGVPGLRDAFQYTQLRDWYTDVHIDTDKVHRLRIGQSKVPYGWENMQSSSNRLPLDRNDALNSAVKNERDLGVFYYWTPPEAQRIFKHVIDEGLKGSGNYGVFGFGFYNGQGGSLREQNDNLHTVARLQCPVELASGQIIELGIQGYTGKYTVLSSPISPLGAGPAITPAGTLEAGNRAGVLDERMAWTAVLYPQPLGLQAEWTVGRGPSLNDDQTAVIDRPLYGGYALATYRFENRHGIWFPFLRYTHYRGGYKSERNSPFSEIDEWEIGLEWQINPAAELVGMYTITDRTNTVARSAADTLSYGQFAGDLLRFQFQFNY